MLILQKVVKDAAAHTLIVKEVEACVRRAARRHVTMPSIIHAEFTNHDQGEAGEAGGEFYITIPYAVAYSGAEFKWMVAHEMAHLAQIVKGEKPTHRAEFYRLLKLLCVPSVLHWELKYRPGAKRYGIRRLRRKA